MKDNEWPRYSRLIEEALHVNFIKVINRGFKDEQK